MKRTTRDDDVECPSRRAASDPGWLSTTAPRSFATGLRALCLAAAVAVAMTLPACNKGNKKADQPQEPAEEEAKEEQPPPGPRGALLPDPRNQVPAGGEIRQSLLIYAVGSRSMLGHFVHHESPGTAPILLLMHDERGIDEWLRERADSYARLGYHVLCPDLSELLNETLDQPVVDNVVAAVAEAEVRLGRQPTGRLAAIGWGRGGAQALTLARHLDLEALVICYGPLVTTPNALEAVREPVLGIFGRLDQVVPESMVTEFHATMQKMGGTFNGNVWSDEGHDFMRLPNDPTNALEANLEIVNWLDTYFEP